MQSFNDIYRGKKVLVTGHTGFKGAWLAIWLRQLGAEAIGFSLDALSGPSIHEICRVSEWVTDIRADIRDLHSLSRAVDQHQPEIIFHLAAQSLVRAGYVDPPGTFATNVMGTVNVLEAARKSRSVKAVVAVTSDKVYRNEGWEWGYRETDALGGHDPYSASKSAAEMAIACYQWPHTQADRASGELAIASARGGNVIGGGDWAPDRLVPDLIRAIAGKQDLTLRYPNATRPWQHVLDCLSGYLHLGRQLLTGDPRWRSAWNFGPVDSRATSVETVCKHLLDNWPGASTRIVIQPGPPGAEMTALRVDSSKSIHRLGWRPTWDVTQSLDRTLDWYRRHAGHGASDMIRFTIDQINAFTADAARTGAGWATTDGGSTRS